MTDNRILFLFGRETTRGQLYGGLYLLFGGFLLGLTALGTFFFANTRPEASLFAWREGALALGAVAVTTFFFGISYALPSKRGMRIASYVGLVLCLIATGLFMAHYPYNFNVADSPDPTQADYTAPDLMLFAAGLAIIVAGAFVSVIGYWVQLSQGPKTEEEDEWTGKGYEVPDWVVEKDIDDAMKRHGVSWGLGEKTDHIHLEVAEMGPGLAFGKRGKVKTVHLSADRVETATATLVKTRPEFSRSKALPGQWADEAVDALRAFQKEKVENPKLYTPKLGFWARLFRRRSQLTPQEIALKEAEAAAQNGVTTGGGRKRGKTIVMEDEA